ncbi:hypothetical protein [Rhodococcus sp. 14-2470-1b]|uniref:hypothetical protein n=1 Tax=Rhodococcus sp. 14-2470-1b TaxID=2023149 RepID=UPI0020CD26C2|nr:hypothetical protein [Rhodococcus sp. 14-2470-1b]
MSPEHPIAPRLTYWQSLAVAADNGQLYLDADTARQCDQTCVNYLDRLDRHRETARRLAKIDGYGDFEMGRQFAQILSDKAAGGQNSMVGVIDSHIQVVKEMQAVFQKFFNHYTDIDADTASDVAQRFPN